MPPVTYARGMGRARGVVPLSLLALVLAACSASGSAEPDAGRSATPAVGPDALEKDALRIEHADDPRLFPAGDGLVVLATRSGEGGAPGAVVTATYADGRWGPVEEVSSGDGDVSGLFATFNDDGAGVAAWTQGDAAGEDRAVARVRDADGSWSEPTELAGMSYDLDVQVDAAGDVAVSGSGRVAVHPAGGAWRTTRVGDESAVTIALDEDGGVHAALHELPRGGGGAISTRYLPPGGSTWSARQPVEVDGVASSDAVRILALPGGAEALVVGTASPNWLSTSDTQIYASTAYRVLRRDARGEPFAPVWEKDGATRLQAEVRGEDVRLLWLQQTHGTTVDDPDGDRTSAPTQVDLTALTLGGQERVLADTEVRPATADASEAGTIEAASGSGCTKDAWVWRPVGVDGVAGDLWVVAGDADGTLHAPGEPVPWGLQASLACAAGDRAWLARVEDAEVREAASDLDDPELLDSAVVVAPL